MANKLFVSLLGTIASWPILYIIIGKAACSTATLSYYFGVIMGISLFTLSMVINGEKIVEKK